MPNKNQVILLLGVKRKNLQILLIINYNTFQYIYLRLKNRYGHQHKTTPPHRTRINHRMCTINLIETILLGVDNVTTIGKSIFMSKDIHLSIYLYVFVFFFCGRKKRFFTLCNSVWI